MQRSRNIYKRHFQSNMVRRIMPSLNRRIKSVKCLIPNNLLTIPWGIYVCARISCLYILGEYALVSIWLVDWLVFLINIDWLAAYKEIDVLRSYELIMILLINFSLKTTWIITLNNYLSKEYFPFLFF